MSKEGVVNIRGKEYVTVAKRVNDFREKYGNDMSIHTEIIENTANRVVMNARIVDKEGRVLATGHGEEFRASSQINKTSALENCETSAIGRALACMGMGGTEFASANEVQQAIHSQEQDYTPDMKLVFDELIAADESFEFYVWFMSQSEAARTGLMNSFEKGTVTAMKKKVRQMEKDGSARFSEYWNQFKAAIDDKDTHSAEELWHEMGKEGAALLWKDMAGDDREFMKEIFK